jgi:hypothetical protein
MTRDVSKNRVQHIDILVLWEFRIQIFKTHINKNRVKKNQPCVIK